MWFSAGCFLSLALTPQRLRSSVIPVQLLRKLLKVHDRYHPDTVSLLSAGETILTTPEKDDLERPLLLCSSANVAGSTDFRLRRSAEAPAILSSDRESRVRLTELQIAGASAERQIGRAHV